MSLLLPNFRSMLMHTHHTRRAARWPGLQACRIMCPLYFLFQLDSTGGIRCHHATYGKEVSFGQGQGTGLRTPHHSTPETKISVHQVKAPLDPGLRVATEPCQKSLKVLEWEAFARLFWLSRSTWRRRRTQGIPVVINRYRPDVVICKAQCKRSRGMHGQASLGPAACGRLRPLLSSGLPGHQQARDASVQSPLKSPCRCRVCRREGKQSRLIAARALYTCRDSRASAYLAGVLIQD